MVLIIHYGALGDFVVSFPALLRLKQSYSQIDVICQNKLGKLGRDLNVIDKWFPIEARYFASLYSDPVDQKIKDILNAYKEIILFSFSKDLEQKINNLTGKNIHRIPPRPDATHRIHVTEHILLGLERCGLFESPAKDYGSILPPAEYSDRKNTSYDIRSYDIGRILIHPGSGSRKKNWPVQNFLKIEAILRTNNMKPEFILGPAEDFLAGELMKQPDINRRVHIVSDLSELAVLLKTAVGFIGNDSGVSHLSAFLGLPTVTVFGPSDPMRWRPVGPAVKAVRPDLDCIPCFENNKNNCDSMECLNKTTPEIVIDAFYTLTSSR